MREELGHDDAKCIRRLFDQIDANMDGNISRAEFKAVFQDHSEQDRRHSTQSGTDTALLEFKDKIRHMFKTQKQAFDSLGGSDDALIDPAEFEQFMREELGHDDAKCIRRLFDQIDANMDGNISRAEFKAVFQDHSEQARRHSTQSGTDTALLEFKEKIRHMFKTQKQAFDSLGRSDDALIDPAEFEQFMREELGHDDAKCIRRLFDQIDANMDGNISRAEFKAVFQDHSEQARRHSTQSGTDTA